MSQDALEMSFFKKPITNKKPLKTVNLLQVYQVIRSHYYETVVRLLRSIVDKEAQRRFKAKNLDYITPSGVFSYCNDESLISHSGVLCMDLDDVEDTETLKQQLIDDTNFITFLLFSSPCGKGLKWFIAIDLDVCDHRTWFSLVCPQLSDGHIRIDRQTGR